MTMFKSVNSQAPCHVCGKTDWCSVAENGAFAICRRVNAGGGRAKFDKSGAEYWVYRLVPAAGTLPGPTPSIRPATPIDRPAPLPAAELDLIYRRLLDKFGLSTADRAGLMARGLSGEHVTAAGYRTLPPKGRHRPAAALVEAFGAATIRRVPGFYFRASDGGGYWTVAGPAGLLIPVRNASGLITALKIRREDQDLPKYVYSSSAKHGGLGSGAPVHVPHRAKVDGEAAPETIRLTEGELKADVATALSGMLTVSISGVANWRPVIKVLRELGCTTCRLAFDMDVLSNAHVANALKSVALQLIVDGFQIELEQWDPERKGIDDCLVDGINPRVIRGGRAYAEVVKIFERLAPAVPAA